MPRIQHPPYVCPICGHSAKKGDNIRNHFKNKHPDDDYLIIEKHIINTKCPDFNLEQAIQDYIDKKATVWTIKNQCGLKLTKFFRRMGILRTYGEDITLQRKIKHGSVSVHDNPNYISAIREKYGVDNPLQSEEIRDKKMMTHLKKDGLEELFPAVKTLRKLKNLRRAKNEAAKEQSNTPVLKGDEGDSA